MVKTAFRCGHCGSRLLAKASLAGRTSRCPKCGAAVVVPAAAAATNDWRQAVAHELDPQQPRVSRTGSSESDADDAEAGYRLKTVTPVGVPALDPPPPKKRKQPAAKSVAKPSRAKVVPPPAATRSTPAASPKASVAREPESKPDELFGDLEEVAFEFNPPEVVAAPSDGITPLADVRRVYRSLFSLLARATNGISEASYTVSFVLLIFAVAGGIIGQHGLASLSLGIIVLLNVIGVIGDVASLVMLSFRKDPMQGLLFLLPPYAAYYLWSDWKRYRDVVGRMRIPLLMLGGVAVAYAFVPWLSVESSASPSDGEAVQQADAAGQATDEGESSSSQSSVGYGVGGVEAAAQWVWSFVGGEPGQLFRIGSEASQAEPELEPATPDGEAGLRSER